MAELIQEAISLGQNSILRQLPATQKVDFLTAQVIYPKRSRQKVAKSFSEYAHNIFMEKLEKFKKQKYACLAIDAGRINGMPILDITLAHSFVETKPLLFKVFRNFSGRTECYIELVKDTIKEIMDHGIFISSIVGDNLIAQKSAFDHGSNSMQIRNLGTPYAAPFWFSCICHTLSLGLRDAMESDHSLSKFASKIKDISIIFRSKPMVATLKVICPSYCPTRWTNLYDIALWLICHSKQIEDLILNPPFPILDHLKIL